MKDQQCCTYLQNYHEQKSNLLTLCAFLRTLVENAEVKKQRNYYKSNQGKTTVTPGEFT
jgi:hypothetical protein